MKLGVISDIHSDVAGLELAWSHLTVMGADQIVSAGDLTGYGPFPDRVIAFLSASCLLPAASVCYTHYPWQPNGRQVPTHSISSSSSDDGFRPG
jgi:hypothetical protein